MSKAVYYKSHSPNVVDFVEQVYSYKLYPLSDFCLEHSAQCELYIRGVEDGETTITTVYHFPNSAEYESLLSDSRHPANSLPAFINEADIKKFCEQRDITITYEVIDNWTITPGLSHESELSPTRMSDDEIVIAQAVVNDVSAGMESTNDWSRYLGR